MNFFVRFWLVFSCMPCAGKAFSQTNTGRIGVMDLRLVDFKQLKIRFTCTLVNTGERTLTLGREPDNNPANVVVEFDTLSLPAPLRGREAEMANLIRQQKISIPAGKLSKRQHFSLQLQARSGPTEQGFRVCSDLAFDTVYIMRYTDESILLRYIVGNKGPEPAYLLGKKKSDRDNLAIQAFFTTGLKRTRGSIPADITYIKKDMETLDGWLMPGQLLAGEILVKLKNRTKFTPNIILELDPFQVISDCKRQNNQFLLQLSL